jgi:predicted ester cyclase
MAVAWEHSAVDWIKMSVAGGAMAVSTAIASIDDIRAFIDEYFDAWSGTDENRILSYYSETVSLEIPGTIINGKVAVRDQFVRPFIAGFPGNRHIVKKMIFGKDLVVVEWSFEAAHKGPFAGTVATGSAVKLPGCGVYEFDPVKRQVTAARIYFDVTTLLKQVASHQPQLLQNLLISWFASRAYPKSGSAHPAA